MQESISTIKLTEIVLVITIIFALVERIVNRTFKTKNRKLLYCGAISLPISLSIVASYFDYRYSILFVLGVLIGSCCEWLLGYYYEKIMGEQLWKYDSKSLNGHTSLRVLPYWGLAGVSFGILTNLVFGN